MPMHLHHFVPHMQTVAVILTSALAGAAVVLAMKRERRAGSGARSIVGSRFSWRKSAAENFKTAAPELSSSANSAFDDYRRDEMQKLEAEAVQFRTYLDTLRRTKDQSEFEAFLQTRRAIDRHSG